MIKKHITTNTIQDLYGLDQPEVWDTEKAFLRLKKVGAAQTKRTAERQLRSLELLPVELNPEILEDENGQSPNKILLNWAIGRARKQRDKVLFGQLHILVNGRICLHANDARGARYWVPLVQSSLDEVTDALIKLQQHIGKSITFFPHRNLLAYLRQISSLKGVNFYDQVYCPVISKSLTLNHKPHNKYRLSPHLKKLEAESIHIIREAVAEACNPVMMYSIGKDSGVMLHLARKAFYPSTPPFPLLHIDTRWKFQEMYLFRDFIARESGMDLIIHTNPEAIEKNINPFDHGSALHTEITKTVALKQALDLYKFDVVFGGARRDEEKSRAKERIFSFRTNTHHWDPKNQRPELWNLFNTKKNPKESLRVFPLSNWTELDIWQYIYLENIPVVPLYFAKSRPVITRPEIIMMVDDQRCQLNPDDEIELKKIRFRTLGCYPLTGAIESHAETIEDILLELINTRQSERQGRKIDSDAGSSMEKKKQEGYF